MFDGDAYLRALDPPAIRLGGRTYTGRTLSINEWVPFEPLLRKIQSGEGTLADAYDVIGGFCKIAFRRPWWRAWMFWKRPVHKLVMALPPAALKEATTDFLQSQARAMGAVETPARDDIEASPSDSQPVT